MVASNRAEKESAEKEETEQNPVSAGRLVMERQTHFIELMQSTRVHLENGEISKEELAESLRVRLIYKGILLLPHSSSLLSF
jgi:hypothetical protein